MQKLAWCPPGVSLALASVMVPRGELTEAAWWEALSDRVTSMALKEPDPEQAGVLAARALGTPQPDSPEQTGEAVFRHNLELRTAMTLAVMAYNDPFPAHVEEDDPEAREAIEEADLALWLDLACAMVSPSSWD